MTSLPAYTTLMPLPWLFIDFDSTFVTAESLELLGEIALADHADAQQKLASIRDLTNRAMCGQMPFAEALRRRFELIQPRPEHLEPLIAALSTRISPSFRKNAGFLRANAGRIYIMSSGFHEYIDPVVAEFGIAPDHVLANRLTTAPDGTLSFDPAQPLANDGGKVAVARQLHLPGPAFVIGDGVSDRELAASGLCERFYAYTENARRAEVLNGAEHVADSLDAVLEQLPSAAPAGGGRILLLEGIHAMARERLEAAGYEVELLRGSPAPRDLLPMLSDVTLLGIRSKTHVTEELLEHAPKLLGVGAFCIGTNQIDLEACTRKGIAVFNAPFSNTRSVAELALAEIILLTRNLPDKIRAMHAGHWRKSASGSHEVRGKSLGIIGYGKIGMQLSVLAEALGMQVCYFDLVERLALGNAVRCASLEELLATSDVVSIHVDGRPGNRNLFDAGTLAKMKRGAILVNLSRGHVIDLSALDQALEKGHLRGAALDVYPEEPSTSDSSFECVVAQRPNVILTPHIGGSTVEAQLDIAQYVSARLTAYMAAGISTGSVNLPELAPDRAAGAHRLAHLHENVPGTLAAIDRVLAERHINIAAQHLATNADVGYVLTDVEGELDEAALADLAAIPHTLRSRALS